MRLRHQKADLKTFGDQRLGQALTSFARAALQKSAYAKEASWVIAGQVLAGVGAIFGVRLLTHAMTPAEYGEFNLALTGTMLIHMFSSGPIGQAATRYFGQANETNTLRAYLRGLSGIVGAATLGLLVSTLAAVGLLQLTPYSRWTTTVLWWLGYSLLYGGITIVDAIQSGDRRRAISALHQAASQWLRPCFAIFLLAIAGNSRNVALAGFAVANLLVFASQLIWLRQSLHVRFENGLPATEETTSDYSRQLFKYAWPFASYGILSWSQFASDRWMLEFYQGPQSVAAFSVSYQLGYQPMNLLTSAISAFLSPILFGIAGSGQDAYRVSRATRMNWLHVYALLGVTVIVTLVGWLLHKFIYSILAAPAYAAYSGDLPLMIAAGGLFACGQALTMMFFLGADSGAIIGPKVSSSIAGILFNFIGVRYFGIRGAVIATLLFSALYASIVAQQVRRWQLARKPGLTAQNPFLRGRNAD